MPETKSTSIWRELLANPLTIAIVGGFVTLMTQIVTARLDAAAERDAEKTRADLARASEQRTLQAELIKKFAEAPDLKTARGNLEFLVDAGLLPDYQTGIKKYLDANPEGGPRLSAVQAVSQAVSQAADVAAKLAVP